jgi:hypothetical protein
MRTDENGDQCPGTLCAVLSPLGDKCQAVVFLDEKIAEQGRDEEVNQHDSQMRALLMPMMLQPA